VTLCKGCGKEQTMVGTRTEFTGELAPCGRTVDGEHYRDDDEEGLVIRDEYYRCGCRRILHLYHDGSVHSTAIRHNGAVVRESYSPDHGF
jgi:hypothetical protein